MADPILANTYRAQLVLQGPSDLPEDRWVTTYAFQGADPGSIPDILGDLWAGGSGAYPGTGIGQWISPVFPRANATARVYDLSEPPGEREPVVTPVPVAPAMGSAAYPAECAIAVTLGNSAVPRRRGRFYIGPLNNATGVVANGALMVDGNVLGNIRDACAAVSLDTRMQWGVISQVDGVFFPVDQGHVDNAFDTQRRRGEDATQRVLWPGPE